METIRRESVIGFLAFLGIVLTGLPQTGQAAFGISPPFIHATHLVAGARYAQTVYLVQDRPDQDLPIKAEIDVPDRIRSWITIDRGENFSIPQGVRQFAVTIIIQVPQDTDLGAYNGKITFTSDPAQTGQVTIALGTQVSIDITVGNDIYRFFTVPVIRLMDIEEGWNPRVYVKFNNEGNVPESFDRATYELLDQYGAARLAVVQKNKGFPETLPFTIKEYTVDFPIDFHLGLGQYWGKVDFYQQDRLVASQKTVFNVLEKGSLSSPWSGILTYLRENWPLATGVLAILVGLGAAGLLWRKRRRHRLA